MGVRVGTWVTRCEREPGVLGLRTMALSDHNGVIVGLVTEVAQESGRFYHSVCSVCGRTFANVNGRRGGFPYALGTYVEHYGATHQPGLASELRLPVVVS